MELVFTTLYVVSAMILSCGLSSLIKDFLISNIFKSSLIDLFLNSLSQSVWNILRALSG
jgi:hypothetical protein